MTLTPAPDSLIYFTHKQEVMQHYERGLDIGNAFAYVRYDCGGVYVERKYFMTYQDKVLVGRINTSGCSDFNVELQIPYLTEEEGREKRGIRKTAERYAADFVRKTVPEKYIDKPGECELLGKDGAVLSYGRLCF